MRFLQINTLSKQILFSVVAATLLMVSVVSGLTTIHERDRMLGAARQDARQSVAQSLSAISRDLGNLDINGLNAFLNGLTLSGSIIRAEVLKGDRIVVASSRHDHAVTADRVWTVDLTAPDDATKIGVLRISESDDELRTVLADNAIAEIAAELIQIGGLAAILFIIVHQLITRHLTALAREVQATALSEDGTAPPICLHRGKPRHDELQTLVEAINRFRCERAQAERELLRDIAERRKVEAALQESEASLSEALKISRLGYWQYDVDEDLFVFNDQYFFLAHREEESAMSLMDFNYAPSQVVVL